MTGYDNWIGHLSSVKCSKYTKPSPTTEITGTERPRALLALYREADDVRMVARDREAQRATAGLASRTILEMAVCECPEVEGNCLSRWELDELLADVTLMLRTATDSDAINNDLGELA